MKLLAKRLIVATVAFSIVNPLIWVPPAHAQFQRDRFDRRQLDQDLAPIALYPDQDRKSTRLNSSHSQQSRMPSSA